MGTETTVENITSNEKLKVSRDRETDLEKQIKALQKAFAQERGDNNRFRDEVRAYLQRGHL
jgi:hypothetical protein